MSKPNTLSFRPGVLQLESREVPAIASVQSINGVVTVQTDNASTTVLVLNTGGGILVQDLTTNVRSWSFSYGQANRVDIFGGIGNDTFTARGNVRTRMYGFGGNDTMFGGTGRDVIVGGGGQDRMFGRNGNDYLDGAGGNDHLDGGNGNDVILGGVGDDYLIGRAGADAFFGDAGNDTIVAIDDTTGDVVDGGGGVDVLWVDQNGAVTDLITGANPADTVNAVDMFSNAGADRTLNGDRIADPKLAKDTDVYETFSNRPLFSSQGPSEEDLSQGTLGDCWVLAGLGSTARVAPDIIRSRVVDFGDGTYGVRLEDPDLGSRFFRVDNDLPVSQNGNTFTEYTAVGIENSVWVAIMEKAYAHFRVPGADSYGSLEGGFLSDTYRALGLDPELVLFSPLSNATEMSDTIREMVDSGSAAGIAIYTAGAGVPLVESHQFILLDYELDAITGLVRTVTLRNPWGIDGPGSTAGPNNDNNFEDGILTITLDQLRTCTGAFEWAPIPA